MTRLMIILRGERKKDLKMANNSTIATAYVQVKPSMEGVKGELTQQFDGEGAAAGKSFGAGFSGALTAASGAAVAAVGAATTAVGALGAEAVKGYAEYEQLIGGVETLFGKDAQTVIDNASVAFQGAGMSMNDYMETSIQSAAALINSLEGDTAQAAKLMDMSIVDMSDNVNKMGTSMEAVQNAYRGFSRGNFTMLDNLALGFAGTKEGMQELLNQAKELSGIEYDISSYSDIVQAIHVIQEQMGVAGTTQKEAADTISGSLAMTKSAWDNLITGIARDDVNLDALINNLVTSATTAFENIEPVVERAVLGIASFIDKIVPILMDKLPGIITTVLPQLLEVGARVVASIGQGIVTNLPSLLNMGLEVMLKLADGITKALPTLTPTLVSVVLDIIQILTDNAPQLVEAALAILTALNEGLIASLPILIEKAPEIVQSLLDALLQSAPMLLQAGLESIMAIITGITNNLPQILTAAGQIIQTLATGIIGALGFIVSAAAQVVDTITKPIQELVKSAITWGRDLIQGFINGIKEAWDKLKGTVTDIAGAIKDYLGFSEPKKGPLSDFHTYAPDMMELFAKGIRENESVVTGQIAKSFNVSGEINAQATVGEVAVASPVYSASAAEVATATPKTENADTNKMVDLLGQLVDKDPVEIGANASGIFDIVRKQNNRYSMANGRSAFAT